MAHRISHRNTPAQLESWRRQQQPSNDREYNVAEPLLANPGLQIHYLHLA